MNDPVHPTLDEVADLHERLLEPGDAASVEAHLSGCTDCAALLSALEDVSVQLADVGAGLTVMPASVAVDLNAALDRARVEREAGVSSVADRRTSESTQPSPTSSRSRPAWILLGAAAAAAAIALPTGLGMLNGGSSDEPAASSADAGQAEAGGEVSAAEDSISGDGSAAGGGSSNTPKPGAGEGHKPGSKNSPEHSPEPVELMAGQLNRRNLVAFAVAADNTLGTSIRPSRCSTYDRLDTADAEAALAAPARWRGERAVVLLDRTASSVSVYECMTPGALLYRTGY